jgi:tripartite-type tricarboxylate transporter receptor subunit TctC
MQSKSYIQCLQRGLLNLAGAAGLTLCSLAAHAAGFPAKPVRFIVPFPPGSATDTAARYFGAKFTSITGQPAIIENKAGGNGFIAVQNILSAPADGYTVFIGSNSTLAVNVAVFKHLPYNPQTDLAPLSIMTRAPIVLSVPASSPYKTVADLVKAAKANPGKLNYGSGSAGYQLAAELFNVSAGVAIQNVPYKGASESLASVAGGTVDMTTADITATQALAKGGKIRALVVASEKRSSALPDTPSAKEAGLPDFQASIWVAAMVSVKTPKPETDKLVEVFTQIERMPETREFLEKQGAEVMSGGPEELRNFQAKEIQLWKRIVEKAHVELQ